MFQIDDFLLRGFHLGGDLIRPWLSPKLLHQLFGPVQISIEPLHNMHRQPYKLSLINDGTFNVLPDPPRGIRAESKAPFIIKLLDGLNQSKVALFDNV